MTAKNQRMPAVGGEGHFHNPSLKNILSNVRFNFVRSRAEQHL
jgi:hypothetical protein